jgi:pimeloyl-ACP methyl ester carboxylesterase
MEAATTTGPSRRLRRRAANPVPAPVRGAAYVLGRIAPGFAARIAERLFLRPPRKRTPSREASWIADAAPLRLRGAGRELAGWTVGDGPCVLLVHGWGGRGSQLAAFVGPLVDRGFRVVGFDAPGHGGSEGRRSSVPEMAAAVEEVGAQLGPLRAVVAHSLGCTVTTVALSKGFDAERCVYFAPPTELPYFTRGFCRLLGFGSGVARRMRQRVERRFDVRFDDLHAPRLARRLDVPLLIAHDRDDRDVPLAHAEELAWAWRDARLMTTRGLGHRAILRNPHVVRHAVDFIAEPADERVEAEAATGVSG